MIKTECFQRFIDQNEKSAQYPGWPQTVSQEENYGRKAKAYLPEINIQGLDNPVVQIINEKTNTLEYSIRLNKHKFKAKIFDITATYSVKVGNPETNTWQIKKRLISDNSKISFVF